MTSYKFGNSDPTRSVSSIFTALPERAKQPADNRSALYALIPVGHDCEPTLRGGYVGRLINVVSSARRPPPCSLIRARRRRLRTASQQHPSVLLFIYLFVYLSMFSQGTVTTKSWPGLDNGWLVSRAMEAYHARLPARSIAAAGAQLLPSLAKCR